jgi:hypothetical protein
MNVFRISVKAIAAIAVASLVCSVPTPEAAAAPQCLKTSNQCSPDKLCTFKAALAEKVLLYQTYLRNSQVTKRRGKRDGVRYDGRLYDESVNEARRDFPRESREEQMVRAGQIFQEKIRAYVNDKYKTPACNHGGTFQRNLFPKAGYTGMYTTEQCAVRVRFEGGEYDPAGFGANDATSCQEFYDRDRAHEVIHQRRCQAAKDRGMPQTFAIDSMIEEEVLAYEHSVRLTHAYVRLLSIQCSAQATPDELQSRAKRIQDLLAPYLAK